PCYISSEEEVLKEKLVEISEDKHVPIKNNKIESSNNEVEEKEKSIIGKIITTSNNNKKRKEYEVFVCGLDRDADEDDLMDVFKRNKGFAFVRFASVELAKKATAELNYTLPVDKLKPYELDNLEQIDLIEYPNDSARNRGYAFLSFSTHMDVVAACSKLHKGNIGKSVRADIAFAKSVDVMAQVKSVFLDGLPDDWDENTVYEHLKKYGRS
ncbi:hypothetical protein MKW94_029081, partial [Papaver nudicaule]|nr:hypothetical protein [Papaver nudicaule]